MRVYNYLIPDDRSGGTLVSNMTPTELVLWGTNHYGRFVVVSMWDISQAEVQQWIARGLPIHHRGANGN